MIYGQQDFFYSNVVGRIFFPSKCSAGYFSPPHFSAVFFSSKRVTCLHMQNVLTFIAVFFFFFENRVNESFIFFEVVL